MALNSIQVLKVTEREMMTIQVPEVLMYQGEKLRMCAEPLRGMPGGIPSFTSPVLRTSCWRKYVGHWEIINDRLYLTNLEGRIKKEGSSRDLLLSDFFPDAKDKVFAPWITGVIRCESGRDLGFWKHELRIYGGPYEVNHFFKFDQGLLRRVRIVKRKDVIDFI
jgi:hypothetical protein